MVKEQGGTNLIGAYYCAENEEYPEKGVLININVFDESESYPMDEKAYLNEYTSNLPSVEAIYSDTGFLNVNAIEYSYDQMGLPTKAIFFLKNQKAYLLQVGTRKNLHAKYLNLKNSFEILSNIQ